MKTLVIATDLGPTSQPAVAYGASLARDLGAQVLLVHAWQPTEITVLDATIIMPAARQAEAMKDLQSALDAAAEVARAAGVAVTARLLDGALADVIAAVAVEVSAEMVVVGTTLPRLATRILGSNADAVIRAVRCPVLVVHGPG